MTVQRISGILMLVGSIFFLIGAFSPISWDFFQERLAEKKIEIIHAAPGEWHLSQFFFG